MTYIMRSLYPYFVLTVQNDVRPSERGLFDPLLRFFVDSAKTAAMYICSDIFSAHLMNILTQVISGQVTKSGQVTQLSKKVCDPITVIVIERMF